MDILQKIKEELSNAQIEAFKQTSIVDSLSENIAQRLQLFLSNKYKDYTISLNGVFYKCFHIDVEPMSDWPQMTYPSFLAKFYFKNTSKLDEETSQKLERYIRDIEMSADYGELMDDGLIWHFVCNLLIDEAIDPSRVEFEFEIAPAAVPR